MDSPMELSQKHADRSIGYLDVDGVYQPVVTFNFRIESLVSAEEDEAPGTKGTNKFYKVENVSFLYVYFFVQVKIFPLHLSKETPEGQYVEWPVDDIFK